MGHILHILHVRLYQCPNIMFDIPGVFIFRFSIQRSMFATVQWVVIGIPNTTRYAPTGPSCSPRLF